jgi:hypothetical protein
MQRSVTALQPNWILMGPLQDLHFNAVSFMSYFSQLSGLFETLAPRV